MAEQEISISKERDRALDSYVPDHGPSAEIKAYLTISEIKLTDWKDQFRAIGIMIQREKGKDEVKDKKRIEYRNALEIEIENLTLRRSAITRNLAAWKRGYGEITVPAIEFKAGPEKCSSDAIHTRASDESVREAFEIIREEFAAWIEEMEEELKKTDKELQYLVATKVRVR